MCVNILCGLLSILMFTFELTEVYQSKLLFFIWVVSIFFTFSGIFVIFPTACAQVFGRMHAGTIYGILFTAPVRWNYFLKQTQQCFLFLQALVSLFGALIIQIILKNLGWFGSFSTIGLFSSVGNKLFLLFAFYYYVCWYFSIFSVVPDGILSKGHQPSTKPCQL